MGSLLPEFYPDLAAAELCDAVCAVSSALCDEHAAGVASRAAGTASWAITARSTRCGATAARMAARDSTLPVECKPVLTKDGTDSTSLDETIELISQNGRTISESVRMLLPPARATVSYREPVPAVPLGLHGAVGWPGGDCVLGWRGRGRGAGPQWSAALPVRDNDGRIVGGGLGGGAGGSRSGDGPGERTAGAGADDGARYATSM